MGAFACFKLPSKTPLKEKVPLGKLHRSKTCPAASTTYKRAPEEKPPEEKIEDELEDMST